MAGCATSIGSAGHATAGATANFKLTLQMDHSVAADHASKDAAPSLFIIHTGEHGSELPVR